MAVRHLSAGLMFHGCFFHWPTTLQLEWRPKVNCSKLPRGYPESWVDYLASFCHQRINGKGMERIQESISQVPSSHGLSKGSHRYPFDHIWDPKGEIRLFVVCVEWYPYEPTNKSWTYEVWNPDSWNPSIPLCLLVKSPICYDLLMVIAMVIAMPDRNLFPEPPWWRPCSQPRSRGQGGGRPRFLFGGKTWETCLEQRKRAAQTVKLSETQKRSKQIRSGFW